MRNQIDQKSLYVERSGDKDIYYSYNTTVAVKTPVETYVCENVWSVTTARHFADSGQPGDAWEGATKVKMRCMVSNVEM